MKRRFYLIITLVILTGCVSSTNHENKGGTTQSALLPTSTVTLAPTETFTITPTPTFAPVPRQPINTPVEKDKDKIALELLETNNDCELPCWWGIIPNKTRWTDAEVFLKLFSKISERHSPKWDVYEVYSPLPVEYSDVYAVRAVFAAQEGIVREIEVGILMKRLITWLLS